MRFVLLLCLAVVALPRAWAQEFSFDLILGDQRISYKELKHLNSSDEFIRIVKERNIDQYGLPRKVRIENSTIQVSWNLEKPEGALHEAHFETVQVGDSIVFRTGKRFAPPVSLPEFWMHYLGIRRKYFSELDLELAAKDPLSVFFRYLKSESSGDKGLYLKTLAGTTYDISTANTNTDWHPIYSITMHLEGSAHTRTFDHLYGKDLETFLRNLYTTGNFSTILTSHYFREIGDGYDSFVTMYFPGLDTVTVPKNVFRKHLSASNVPDTAIGFLAHIFSKNAATPVALDSVTAKIQGVNLNFVLSAKYEKTHQVQVQTSRSGTEPQNFERFFKKNEEDIAATLKDILKKMNLRYQSSPQRLVEKLSTVFAQMNILHGEQEDPDSTQALVIETRTSEINALLTEAKTLSQSRWVPAFVRKGSFEKLLSRTDSLLKAISEELAAFEETYLAEQILKDDYEDSEETTEENRVLESVDLYTKSLRKLLPEPLGAEIEHHWKDRTAIPRFRIQILPATTILTKSQNRDFILAERKWILFYADGKAIHSEVKFKTTAPKPDHADALKDWVPLFMRAFQKNLDTHFPDAPYVCGQLLGTTTDEIHVYDDNDVLVLAPKK